MNPNLGPDERIPRADRAKRRLMVRFGLSHPEKTGFTKNISEAGCFVMTNTVFRPGTPVQLELEFPDRTFTMWGKVAWAKKVPPQLAHVLECGMGLRFQEPDADWAGFYEGWRVL